MEALKLSQGQFHFFKWNHVFFPMTLLQILWWIQRPTTQGHSSHAKYENSWKIILCPNGRKKSHCMLVRRAAWSQLCLGVKMGRNVHTARFNGRKCSYRPKQDCPRLTTHSHATRLFPPIWTQNVVCTSSDMVAMWLVWIPPSLRSGGYTSHSSQSPPCRPWYTIYYYVPLARKLVFPLQLRVTECCVFRYRGI